MEGSEQTKPKHQGRNLRSERIGGACGGEMDGLWMISWDGFHECEMDLGIAAHYDAGAMDGRKTKGAGAGMCGRG